VWQHPEHQQRRRQVNGQQRQHTAGDPLRPDGDGGPEIRREGEQRTGQRLRHAVTREKGVVIQPAAPDRCLL